MALKMGILHSLAADEERGVGTLGAAKEAKNGPPNHPPKTLSFPLYWRLESRLASFLSFGPILTLNNRQQRRKEESLADDGGHW